jgi:dihydrodipicolinate reductase
MATKVAINGFGRIGRNIARAIIERPDCGLELILPTPRRMRCCSSAIRCTGRSVARSKLMAMI